MRSHFSDGFSKGVCAERAPFFVSAVIPILVFTCVAKSSATGANESVVARIERARELVLKGERTTDVKIFKELAHASATNKNTREIMLAWRAAAEVFLTDKSQNQASLAESFWMA